MDEPCRQLPVCPGARLVVVDRCCYARACFWIAQRQQSKDPVAWIGRSEGGRTQQEVVEIDAPLGLEPVPLHPMIAVVARLPKPSQDAAGIPVDDVHHFHLAGSLMVVVLVDAQGVNPQGALAGFGAEAAEGGPETPGDGETFIAHLDLLSLGLIPLLVCQSLVSLGVVGGGKDQLALNQLTFDTGEEPQKSYLVALEFKSGIEFGGHVAGYCRRHLRGMQLLALWRWKRRALLLSLSVPLGRAARAGGALRSGLPHRLESEVKRQPQWKPPRTWRFARLKP